ncbi:MAG: T9SS type A sorting domain-containing protein [Bacteroidales bacterium]|nr:T9SS type A sorting domain-containing protein [Bacteroidales bacterium]
MKNKHLLILIVLVLWASTGFSQTPDQIDLPVTFEEATVDYTLTDFGGAATVLGEDPTNAANTVAVTTKTVGAATWAGTTIGTNDGFATLIPFTQEETTMSVKVYSPFAGKAVRLKVEEHGDATHTCETEVLTTTANAWETLVFDFSNEAPGTATLNLDYNFDKASIFFDFNVEGTGDIYYWDDVGFGGETSTSEPTVAAPTPTENPADVISLFSDAYTDVPVDTWRTDWSSAVLEEVTIEGNAAKKYSALDFVGIETASSPLNVTEMTHLHLDVWSADYTFFGIKLVDFGADGAYGGGDDVEHQIDLTGLNQAEWVSLDIPLSSFTGLTTREHLAQYILVGQPTGATTVYLDNFYFYSGTINPTYSVTFNVTDGAAPIENASIAINGQTLTTNGNGEASIDLEDGTYGYTITATGYENETGDVFVEGASQTVNIQLTESGATMPAVAAPTPTENPTDVISLFSDAYTDVPVDTWRTDWSSAVLEEVTIEGNAAKKYSALDFVGIETASSPLNVTEMTHLHLDVWSADYTFFGIKLVDFGADGAYGGGDDVEHQIDLAGLNQAEWVSLDIPLSSFTGLTTREHLAQYILVGQPTGATTVYIDNFYFYDEASAVNEFYNHVVSIFPNPANDNINLLMKDVEGYYTMHLFDLSGREIVKETGNSLQTTIDISNCNTGSYILIVKDQYNAIVGKQLIVKE